ncbi:MAG: PAS domain S-box protein [Gammaproteobacteria bacterium]|nr:PAS domain S-box protein [Gammaproteobacteria bacterium]
MNDEHALNLDGPIVQTLLDLLPGTLHVKDRDLRYCMVNRNYLERWGAKASEVVGRTSAEAFGDLFGVEADRRNMEVMRTGRALPFYEVAYPDARGGEVILWATKAPILDAQGVATHVLTFSLDITPLKRAQQQLDESEQVRAATIEHSLDCFITADEQGRIIEFNPAAEQVFACTRAQALGRPIGLLLGIGDDVWQRSRALLERAGERFETQGARLDGQEIPLEIALVEIPLRDRRLFTACVRELSERQRVQAELERQRQALYQSERLSVLGTLAAGISHELSNPLSVVVSQAALLASELDDERLRTRVNAIVRAAERCAAIVSAFLDQSRHGPARSEEVVLATVVDSALDLTAHLLREQDVSLRIVHAQPELRVRGDPHQLSQVVLNLLLNASAAMQASDGARCIMLTTAVSDEGTVELSVSDSGPGIAPELRERIFERFFTTKASGAGTGLGLAICRDIITAHGGRISVDQAGSGGAVFRVRLPVSEVGGRGANLGSVPAGVAQSVRVLVVDDEPEIANLLREILQLGGHRVDVVDSGGAALQRVSDCDYDLILSDMRMPGMDGTMLYQALLDQHPPLVKRLAFVTGDTLSPKAAGFLQQTGIAHLSKPFTPRQVNELVMRMTTGGRTRSC